MNGKFRTRYKLVILFLLTSLCMPGTTVLAKEEASSYQNGDRVNPEAMEILQNMATTLADAGQFSMTVRSNYDAPQEDGQMVEFGAVRKIQIKRPEQMRVDLMRSNGDERTLLFNGKQLVVHNLIANVYSKTEYQNNLDTTIQHLVNDLKIPLPLARLFLSTLPADFTRLIQELDYVEQDVLTTVPSHQLAARTRDVDFQIWVGMGKEALLQRIVITYKKAKQAPQFRADFTDWDFSAEAVKGPFDFVPPEGSEEIPLLIPKAKDVKLSMQSGGAS